MNRILALLLGVSHVLIAIGDGVKYIAKLFYRVVLIAIHKFSEILSIKQTFRLVLRVQKKRLTFKQLKTVIHTFFWSVRCRISPKATNRHPFTIYPAPLHLAWRLQSFFAGVIATVTCILIPFALSVWVRGLPNPKLLTNRDIEVSTKIFDRNGIQLYEIYADQNRSPLPITEIPDLMQKATIAIEDRSFYRHQGFSVRGIVRAATETLINKNLQGGSTITQQLIKSALLSPEITVSRKLKELALAFWAEQIYSKNQILEMYLNQVPYGGTAWGIESASYTYFGTSVKNLSLAQMALLAGLPAAPSLYSPFGSSPQLAITRQREVIRRMLEERMITKKQADEALREPLRFTSQKNGIQAPHFVMYVKQILEKRYGTRMVERGGLRVTTSLDLNIQHTAETILTSQLAAIQSLQVGNGAVLMTNPGTGEILAMVGSRNYFDAEHDGNVNVTTSLRQPGSSIKVVTYAAALENGFTAASIVEDSPVSYQIPGSPPYTPVNYDGRFHGPVPLRFALGNSFNIPAVKILAKIGVETMIEKGRQMGITSWEDSSRFGLSLTLGGGEVTMTDIAKVYGVLANRGKQVNLLPVLNVSDYTGRVIDRFFPESGKQALKPETAWIISHILADNAARTAAFGPNSSLVITGKTVSVKTGTSNEKRDNWTVGYTPSLLTAVWVGNNDNSPMNPQLTSGVTGAAPIWHDIMTTMLQNRTDEIPAKPDSVLTVPCYFGKTEYFTKGTEPTGGRCTSFPTQKPTPMPVQ